MRPTRPRPRTTHSSWFWPPSPTIGRTIRAGFSRFEHTLTIEVDPGPAAGYLWGHQFRFVGGAGGHVGLQSGGRRPDGSAGKLAVFAIGDGRPGPGAVRSGGEDGGGGWRIPFEWEEGVTYRLAVEAEGASRWVAAVAPESAAAGGDGQAIGRIEVPPQWRGLESWSEMWTEYLSPPPARCADLPLSRVVFGAPLADGAVQPDHHHDHLGDGTCSGSSVEPVPGGVRHQMGA